MQRTDHDALGLKQIRCAEAAADMQRAELALRRQAATLTGDMVYEALQLLHSARILPRPGAAVEDVLQRHQQPEDIPLAPPERSVASLGGRYAWQALPQHPLWEPAISTEESAMRSHQ